MHTCRKDTVIDARKSRQTAALRHVVGFPDLGLLRRLRHDHEASAVLRAL